MKLIKLIPTITLIIVSGFIQTACSSASTRTLAPNEFAIKILPATEVQIVQTSARQDGDGVVVDGEIMRKVTGGRGVIKGHVDIKLLDQEGKTIHQVLADCTPRIIPKQGVMKSSFSARIPITPPQGTLVSVRFHNGPHESP